MNRRNPSRQRDDETRLSLLHKIEKATPESRDRLKKHLEEKAAEKGIELPGKDSINGHVSADDETKILPRPTPHV